MCELLGVSSREKIPCNELLKAFFSHAVDNPDGWGLARFYGSGVSLEKEPVSALESVYLKHRLTDEIREDVLIAHIRKASVGNISYLNSHPFSRRDNSGRLWTLAHNGTIYESPVLEPYGQIQKGSTDSERILLYLVDRINAAGALHDPRARFDLVEEMIHTITPNNMVNLLLYDGELLYAHGNKRDSLYQRRQGETVILASKPLSETLWEPVPLNTLLAFRHGEPAYTGRSHGNEYIKPETTTNESPRR